GFTPDGEGGRSCTTSSGSNAPTRTLGSSGIYRGGSWPRRPRFRAGASTCLNGDSRLRPPSRSPRIAPGSTIVRGVASTTSPLRGVFARRPAARSWGGRFRPELLAAPDRRGQRGVGPDADELLLEAGAVEDAAAEREDGGLLIRFQDPRNVGSGRRFVL